MHVPCRHALLLQRSWAADILPSIDAGALHLSESEFQWTQLKRQISQFWAHAAANQSSCTNAMLSQLTIAIHLHCICTAQ